MKISRRSLLAGLLTTAAVGPALATPVPTRLVSGMEEIPLDLSGTQANKIYDIFFVNDGGTFRLITGPAWEHVDAGGESRGSAALIKKNDIWCDAEGRTYFGSIRTDGEYSFYHHATKSVKRLRA